MWVLVECQDVVVGVSALVLRLPVEGVFGFVGVEEDVGIPAHFLGRRHRVGILLLRDGAEHLQLLLELIVLLTLLLLLILVHFLCRLVGDHPEVFGVEVEVLIQHSAPHLLLNGLLPLCIQLNLVHVFS